MLVAVLFVFSLFVGQLLRLQGIDASALSQQAIDQRLREEVIPATRGAIVDRDGLELATSTETKIVIADPTAMPEYYRITDGTRDYVGTEGAVEDLARITGADPARLQQTLEETEGQYVRLIRDVTPEQWEQVRRLGIPGISNESTSERRYSLGPAFSTLVGWVGQDEVPAGGIEQQMNEALTGEPGLRIFEEGRARSVIATGTRVEEPASPGQDVALTIDSDLQFFAYDAIRARVEETGSMSGFVTISRVDSGEILAAASYPAFDPADGLETVEDLRNPVFEDAYEPGSTGKVITAAALLEQDLIESDTPVVVPYALTRGGRSWHDSTDKPDQYLTFAGVMALSSNKGMILAAEDLSDEDLRAWNERFGIGTATGLGFPGESTGLLPEVANWDSTQRYPVIFGQSVTSNALQQVGVYQAIANDGVMVPPSLVAGVSAPGEGPVEATAKPGRRVVSEETADTISAMLEWVTTDQGTAPQAAVEGYRVAGKTSTASYYDDELGRYDDYTSSFIGYAPAEDPQLVVSVTLQKPTIGGNYGGVQAGPVFSDVMRYALAEEGIPPSETESPEVPLQFEPGDPAPDTDDGTTLLDIAIKDGE